METAGFSASPVDSPVVEDKLANAIEEAERAVENTGEKNTGEDAANNLPSVEFYYGKVLKDGRWIKTGKIYWIYTTHKDGGKKRHSPKKYYRNEKGITSIENCPYKGRVLEFYQRSLGFNNTGDTGNDGRLQGIERSTGDELADQR